MAPFGDVAPALELCRAASRGAGLEVVRELALDAVTRVVAADVAVWIDVDIARGGRPTTVVRSGDGTARGIERLLLSAAEAHPDQPIRMDAGHVVGMALPAPVGHRAAIGLRRAEVFTPEDADRLISIQPIVGCAVLAAWRIPALAGDGALTRREEAVLRSVATGMSDKQAARALGVSPRTVGKHLEHIYAKLGVGGRTEAAALINRSG